MPALLALYWSRQVSRRALPAESFEYLESTALGNTALPVATVPQAQAYDALMRLRDGKVTGRLVLRSDAA